jgi:hypothetical protein
MAAIKKDKNEDWVTVSFRIPLSLKLKLDLGARESRLTVSEMCRFMTTNNVDNFIKTFAEDELYQQIIKGENAKLALTIYFTQFISVKSTDRPHTDLNTGIYEQMNTISGYILEGIYKRSMLDALYDFITKRIDSISSMDITMCEKLCKFTELIGRSEWIRPVDASEPVMEEIRANLDNAKLTEYPGKTIENFDDIDFVPLFDDTNETISKIDKHFTK